MADDAARIVGLLEQTLTFNDDGSTVRAATEALDHLSLERAHFPFLLLSIASGAQNPSHRIAAATYLKNFTRRRIDAGGTTSEVSKEFKDQLLQALLQVEPAVLKVLLEVLRYIVMAEFVKQNSWPELVPKLRHAIENSNLISSSINSKCSTRNALMILLTVVKPFQYFMNPKESKEPVPQQLDSITNGLLVPLLSIFHLFVEKALTQQGRTELETEETLHIICKCLYFALRSHMPSALPPLLASFCGDMIRILESLRFDHNVSLSDGHLLRLKTGKRSLLIFSALVTRHRKYSDKLMSDMVNCLLKIVKYSSNISKLDSLPERIISLAFDVISRVLETGPGWRLLSPHFSFLLDSAIFPALVLNERDISEWEEDADEFIRKNLPSELEEISGWREDLFTARKSAVNLLGVISMSKGPPVSTSSKCKRKKGEKNKRNDEKSSMGELLVLPFLSKFPPPSKDNASDARVSTAYFGVLMAYGGLQDLIQEQRPEYAATLVRTRVLPVYSTPECSPYLVASANWVIGELCSCLPEEMKADVYYSLQKALAIPDMGETSCYPVRMSAAGGICSLLEYEYLPPQWLPLLQITLGRIGCEDEEDIFLFQLLVSMVEAGNGDVAIHIPYIVSSLIGSISKHMKDSQDSWPQVVVRGFETLAAIARSFESSKPEEDEEKKEASEIWLSGQASISKALSELLQQAWLVKDMHPVSYIDHFSSLLRSVMLGVTDQNVFVELRLSELLSAWAELISSWDAWEESEDLSVFDCIVDIVGLNNKFNLNNFLFGEMPSPPAMPVRSQSIIESMVSFVSKAISEYPSATWRACSCVHTLLHVPNYSSDIEGIRQSSRIVFCKAAFSRFVDIREKPCSFWGPLLLVISSCYIYCSDTVERVLEQMMPKGFELWVSSLADLCSSGFDDGLSVESKLKLYVMTLVKVIERLLDMSHGSNINDVLIKSCLVALMEASVKLKEVQEETEDEEDEEDEEEDEETDYDDEDSESDGREETEEEFLERYAKAAAELENAEVIDEGDVEDGEHQIDLGCLEEVDIEKLVWGLMEKHHQKALELVPSELISSFLNAFPQSSVSFPR